MPRSSKPKPILSWATDTELVALTLTLQPESDILAPSHYTTELHSWFLNQVRLTNPTLSTYLHDGQSEKAFSISALIGNLQAQARSLSFSAAEQYQWSIAALSQDVCAWLQQWLYKPPHIMQLRSGTFTIQNWQLSLPATTYETIWNDVEAISQASKSDLSLTFTTPTSFRKRSNHMPLPIPENIFHSYLRRWNNFAHLEFEQDEFLDWINECVVILRHEIRSQKTQAGKQGSVTGFVGAVQFGLTPKAKDEPEYVQLVYALIACAPYFGTGHKVTFGLGQTHRGWLIEKPLEAQQQVVSTAKQSAQPNDSKPTRVQEPISEREARCKQRQAELKQFFFTRKKRQGGERAEKAAEVWAAIVAQQELGKSIADIAAELCLPYDTVKQYAKRARKVLDEG